jgi:hypothetical protein
VLLAAPFALAPLRRVLRIAPPRTAEAVMIMGFSLAPLAMKLASSRARRAFCPQADRPDVAMQAPT